MLDTVSAATNGNGKSSVRDKGASLRAEIAGVTELARRAMIVAGAAVVVALLSPLWSPWLFSMVGGSDPGSARVLVIAVEQLRPAMNANAPFERQLALVRKMMAGDREVTRALDQLAPSAARGVPSADAVRSGFMAAANRVYVAEVLHINPDQRWVNKAMVVAASAVRPHDVARTLNLNSVGPATSVVTAASQRLAEDDLAGAIQAVETLPASYAALTGPWLAQARQRYAAVSGFAALEGLVMSRLPGSSR